MKPKCLAHLLVTVGILVAAATAPTFAWTAEDDRSVSAGRWRVVAVEMNGRTLEPEFVSMLSVLYVADGGWSVLFKNIVVAEGTSTVDPSTDPKSFEMKSLGSAHDPNSGWSYSGIYEMHGNSRRLCVGPAGKPRPATFSTTRRNGQILVTLERITTP